MRISVVMALAVVPALMLGGCGDAETADEGHGVNHPSSSAAPAAEQEVQRFTIAGGKRTAGSDTIEAAVGETVVIEVTSDVADELHLHGYDKELMLEPGKPAKLKFTANIPGVFEIEMHEFTGQLAQLRVTG